MGPSLDIQEIPYASAFREGELRGNPRTEVCESLHQHMAKLFWYAVSRNHFFPSHPRAGRSKQKYLVRYDPRDLSHVYVKDRPGGHYISVPYRDICHPPITQSEHRSVLKTLGRNKHAAINEKTIFAALLEQHTLIEKSRRDTANARKPRRRSGSGRPIADEHSGEYPRRVEPYKVEVWE